jgi:hypothetical protein
MGDQKELISISEIGVANWAWIAESPSRNQVQYGEVTTKESALLRASFHHWLMDREFYVRSSILFLVEDDQIVYRSRLAFGEFGYTSKEIVSVAKENANKKSPVTIQLNNRTGLQSYTVGIEKLKDIKGKDLLKDHCILSFSPLTSRQTNLYGKYPSSGTYDKN